MLMYLTQREWHILALFLLVLIGIVLSGLDQTTLEAYSIPFMLFIVAPAGLYLATDPERIKHPRKQEDLHDHKRP